MHWEGPEANPSFLPIVFDSLEDEGATFIDPFSGFKVSPLEFLSSDPLSPIPPGKCLFQLILNGELHGSTFQDYSKNASLMKSCLDHFSDLDDTVYFTVLTDRSEELWKASGSLGRLKRLFKRKRR